MQWLRNVSVEAEAVLLQCECNGDSVPHLGPYCKLQRMTGLGSVDHCRGSSVARLGCGLTYQGFLTISHYHAASGCLRLHR